MGSEIKYARERGLLVRDLLSLVFALFMQTSEITLLTRRYLWRRHAIETRYPGVKG